MHQSSAALHASVKCRSITGVQSLLNYGAKVNARDNYGNTPLHLAAQLSYLDENRMACIIELLLAGGANVNDRAESGETALHCAMISGEEKLIALLVRQGADVNAKDRHGISPLYLAAQYRSRHIVQMILDRGADVNSRADNGNSALHVAIEVEDESVIRMLLERNADVNLVNKNGETPLSLAVELACARSIYNPWTGFRSINSEAKCSNNTAFELLLKYVAKVTCPSRENLRLINGNRTLRLFYQNCQRELATMKRLKLSDNVSMYKVLAQDTDTVAMYCRDECLINAFKLNLHIDEFPIYSDVLQQRFYNAERRKNLLDSSSATLRYLIESSSLPETITNEIVRYLTTEDLLNLQYCDADGNNF